MVERQREILQPEQLNGHKISKNGALHIEAQARGPINQIDIHTSYVELEEERASIRTMVDAAFDRGPGPQRRLGGFLPENPFEKLAGDDAAETQRRIIEDIHGSRMHMPDSFYRDEYRHGGITDQHISLAVRQNYTIPDEAAVATTLLEESLTQSSTTLHHGIEHLSLKTSADRMRWDEVRRQFGIQENLTSVDFDRSHETRLPTQIPHSSLDTNPLNRTSQREQMQQIKAIVTKLRSEEEEPTRHSQRNNFSEHPHIGADVQVDFFGQMLNQKVTAAEKSISEREPVYTAVAADMRDHLTTHLQKLGTDYVGIELADAFSQHQEVGPEDAWRTLNTELVQRYLNEDHRSIPPRSRQAGFLLYGLSELAQTPRLSSVKTEPAHNLAFYAKDMIADAERYLPKRLTVNEWNSANLQQLDDAVHDSLFVGQNSFRFREGLTLSSFEQVKDTAKRAEVMAIWDVRGETPPQAVIDELLQADAIKRAQVIALWKTHRETPAEDIIKESLQQMGVPKDKWQTYVERSIWMSPGDIGHVIDREQTGIHGTDGAHTIDKQHVVAIRLLTEKNIMKATLRAIGVSMDPQRSIAENAQAHFANHWEDWAAHVPQIDPASPQATVAIRANQMTAWLENNTEKQLGGGVSYDYLTVDEDFTWFNRKPNSKKNPERQRLLYEAARRHVQADDPQRQRAQNWEDAIAVYQYATHTVTPVGEIAPEQQRTIAKVTRELDAHKKVELFHRAYELTQQHRMLARIYETTTRMRHEQEADGRTPDVVRIRCVDDRIGPVGRATRLVTDHMDDATRLKIDSIGLPGHFFAKRENYVDRPRIAVQDRLRVAAILSQARRDETMTIAELQARLMEIPSIRKTVKALDMQPVYGIAENAGHIAEAFAENPFITRTPVTLLAVPVMLANTFAPVTTDRVVQTWDKFVKRNNIPTERTYIPKGADYTDVFTLFDDRFSGRYTTSQEFLAAYDQSQMASTEERAGNVRELLERAGFIRQTKAGVWEQKSELPSVIDISGHGATTKADLYRAAKQCGACDNHPGGHNAEVVCAAANDPEVRFALQQQGIDLKNTFFLATEFNTTKAKDTVYNRDAISDDATRQVVDRYLGVMEDANAINALRLLRALPDDEGVIFYRYSQNLRQEADALLEQWDANPADVDVERFATLGRQAQGLLETRATSWSVAFQERGHSPVNMIFIGSDVAMIQEADIDGEALQLTAATENDPARFLATVGKLGLGILAQYTHGEISNANNGRLASGSKVRLNASGGIGVRQGAKGELEYGVSAQTTWRHKPVRPWIVAQIPPTLAGQVLEQDEYMRNLAWNRWDDILVMDEKAPSMDQMFYRVVPQPNGSFNIVQEQVLV